MAIASAYSRRPTHARVRRSTSPFGGLASFLARFAFVLVIASLATRWLEIVALEELAAPALLAAVAVSGALVAAAATVVDAWLRGAGGAWRAIRAFILAMLVAVPLAFAGYRVLVAEAMPDVSTDPIDPPRIGDLVLAPEAEVGVVPELTTRRYDAAIERVGSAVVEAIGELGWSVDTRPLVPSEADAGPAQPVPGAEVGVVPIPRMRPLTPAEQALRDDRLAAEREAVAEARRADEAVVLLPGEIETPVLGIPSDIAIRLRDDGDSTSVDIRLRTRGGGHDLGENARRAATFLDALDRATGRAGLR